MYKMIEEEEIFDMRKPKSRYDLVSREISPDLFYSIQPKYYPRTTTTT
jgi:hypothetical protein